MAPRTRTCKTLFKLSLEKVSELVVHICIRTIRRFSVCSLVTDRKRKGCSMFLKLREEYSFPSTIEDEVLENCLQIWNDKIGTMFLSEAKEEKVYLMIHYFCLNENSVWKSVLMPNEKKNRTFLLQSNCNVRDLKISKNVRIGTLVNILDSLSSIVVLDIDYYIGHSEMAAIGRFCHNLQKLNIFGYCITPTMAEPLCFRNYFCTDKKILNPVCFSLHQLEGRFDHSAVLIFLRNLQNLKTLKDRYEYVNYNGIKRCAEKQNVQIFPCFLENVKVSECARHSSIDDVFMDFPKLKSLHVNAHQLEAIQSRDNLQVLKIQCNNFEAELLNAAIFTSPWFNLKKLALISFQKAEIDLSRASQYCPSLEVLHLVKCDQKAVKIFIPFQSLRKLLIKGYFHLLKYVSASLTTLCIEGNSHWGAIAQTDMEEILLDYSFPNLEYLTYCDIDGRTPSILHILNLVGNYPNLRTLGFVPRAARQLVDGECKRRNWELKILTKYVTLADLF